MQLIEDTYTYAIQAIDIIATIQNSCSIIATRKFIESLKEYPKDYSSILLSHCTHFSKILEQNQNIFMALYNYQIKIKLFLYDNIYFFPIVDIITIHNKVKEYIEGIKLSAKALQEDKLTTFGIEEYIRLLDNTLVQLFDKIELNHIQKKDEEDWNKSKETLGGIKKYKWILTDLVKCKKKLEVYPECLKNKFSKNKNKKG